MASPLVEGGGSLSLPPGARFAPAPSAIKSLDLKALELFCSCEPKLSVVFGQPLSLFDSLLDSFAAHPRVAQMMGPTSRQPHIWFRSEMFRLLGQGDLRERFKGALSIGQSVDDFLVELSTLAEEPHCSYAAIGLVLSSMVPDVSLCIVDKPNVSGVTASALFFGVEIPTLRKTRAETRKLAPLAKERIINGSRIPLPDRDTIILVQSGGATPRSSGRFHLVVNTVLTLS